MPSTITVVIENTQPVELVDFTRSLLALGEKFKRDVEADASIEMDVKLYVNEMRSGSIIAELSALVTSDAAVVGGAAATLAAMETATAVGDFIEHTKSVIDWLRGRAQKPEKVDAPAVKNVQAILEPVSKDNGSRLKIEITGDNNHAPIVVNYMEANAVQNNAKRYLDSLQEPTSAVRTRVLMYWHQVRNETGPATGEKAVVDGISDRPVKVVFESRSLREEMLYGSVNPLKEGYIVDIDVQTVRGKVAVYKVLQLHERFSLDEDGPETPAGAPR